MSVLEPSKLNASLMRHACLAAIGYLSEPPMSILDKQGIVATLKEAVTTPQNPEVNLNLVNALDGMVNAFIRLYDGAIDCKKYPEYQRALLVLREHKSL